MLKKILVIDDDTQINNQRQNISLIAKKTPIKKSAKLFLLLVKSYLNLQLTSHQAIKMGR